MSKLSDNVAETLRRTPTTPVDSRDRRYVLVLEDGSSSLFHLPRRGAVIIGRGSEAQLRLQHVSVSRRHARLSLEPGTAQLTDLDSSNGTVVNGERLSGSRSSRTLRSGDVIAVGDVSLVFHGEQPAAADVDMVPDESVKRLTLDGRLILIADPAMARLYDLIGRLARSDLPVLIHGETGVGKENAAFAVHHYSPRTKRPFVAINCAAIHESLVESELFGHERGAFSGAVSAKAGLLESASGGTVFLDEVGELSPSVQAKLLRVLEQKTITRVGEVREREVDIRIVAATNRDLEREVVDGRFRQDLFFRLSAATVILPPLRDRPLEIPVLARVFLERACERAGRPALRLSPATLQRLVVHTWPGNVRELRNLMDYLVAAVEEEVIEPAHLPEKLLARAHPVPTSPPSAPGHAPLPMPSVPSLPTVVPAAEAREATRDTAPEGPKDEGGPRFRAIAEELRELERTRMVQALEAVGGVRKRAAELLDMPLRTFVMKLKQYGIR